MPFRTSLARADFGLHFFAPVRGYPSGRCGGSLNFDRFLAPATLKPELYSPHNQQAQPPTPGILVPAHQNIRARPDSDGCDQAYTWL